MSYLIPRTDGRIPWYVAFVVTLTWGIFVEWTGGGIFEMFSLVEDVEEVIDDWVGWLLIIYYKIACFNRQFTFETSSLEILDYAVGLECESMKDSV